MSAWLDILLKVLPIILDLIEKLLARGTKLKPADRVKLGNVLYYLDQMRPALVKAGVKSEPPGGNY